MKVDSAFGWCPYGALYTLDTTQLQNGTMYEFGARIRLANSADTFARHTLGLMKNNASEPIVLDGEQSSYDGGAYPDKWTRLYGVWKASFSPSDTFKVCISGTANKPFQVDDIFAKPLTTDEVGYQPPSTLDASTLIYADGNRLVMGSQKTPFLMKGVNIALYDQGYGNQHALENFKYKNADAASYQEIRDLGFNTVRLMLSYSLFEDDTAPGVYKNEGWALLDRHIQWAKQHGLRLILDMHVPPGGYQSTNNTGFSTNATLKKRLEDLWVAIAQRYRNETTIAAYDLINEPHVNNWFAYAQTVINKIRAVDPHHLIDVEYSFHPSDPGMYKLADNNILYDTHFYTPWEWSGSHTNNTPYTGTVETFKQALREEYGLTDFYDAATDKFTVPFNIGEYGIMFEKYEIPGVNGVAWLQHANAAFDYFGISRQLFHYNESNFGIYQGWNSYPNEHTKTTVALKAALPAINGAEPPPPPPPPSVPDITTTSLTAGTVGATYSKTLSVSNGTSPYSWSISSGSLPAGLSLSAAGVLSGTPTTAATSSFTVKVTDSKGLSDTQTLSLVVNPATATSGNADMALTTFKATATSVTKGKVAEFNFVLQNNGNDVAKNARFVLPLPANTTWVSGASECVPSVTEVVCSFGDLVKGTSRNRYFYLRPAVVGTLTFNGKAVSDTGDSITSNDSKTVTLTVK